ncbi:phasin family protein [Mesobacillus thioparans]|uniref:phasin family protein n=1 Tax=Mesobacillus thioparans TaxID=370439 RepID=UPI0039EE97D2
MNNFLKSGFLLGLGAAVAGKEKLDESFMKLVEKGNMTQAEADTMFDEFFNKGENKSEEWNDEFKKMARSQMSEWGFVTKEELDVIQAQLESLKEEVSVLRKNNLNTEFDQAENGMENVPPGFSKDNE